MQARDYLTGSFCVDRGSYRDFHIAGLLVESSYQGLRVPSGMCEQPLCHIQPRQLYWDVFGINLPREEFIATFSKEQKQ